MNHRRSVAVAALFATTVIAQTPEQELGSIIKTIRYGPLAEQARIQGDVHVKLNSERMTVLSGNQLLAQTARESAKELASVLGGKDVDVTYHFVFVNTAISVPTSRIVKRGNVFERAVLRMFGRKTEKVVADYRCEPGVAPPSDFKITGPVIEIWVYGRDVCLETDAASVVAKR